MLLTTLGSADAGDVLRRSRLGGSAGRVTRTRLGSSGTRGLLFAKHLLESRGLIGAATSLLRLQVSQTSSLGVDLLNLSAAIRVELGDFLAGGGVGSLLKVRAEAEP